LRISFGQGFNCRLRNQRTRDARGPGAARKRPRIVGPLVLCRLPIIRDYANFSRSRPSLGQPGARLAHLAARSYSGAAVCWPPRLHSRRCATRPTRPTLIPRPNPPENAAARPIFARGHGAEHANIPATMHLGKMQDFRFLLPPLCVQADHGLPSHSPSISIPYGHAHGHAAQAHISINSEWCAAPPHLRRAASPYRNRPCGSSVPPVGKDVVHGLKEAAGACPR